MQNKPIRSIREDGELYLNADDLARRLFEISDLLSQDPTVEPYARKVSSYSFERLAYSLAGGNLEGQEWAG